MTTQAEVNAVADRLRTEGLVQLADYEWQGAERAGAPVEWHGTARGRHSTPIPVPWAPLWVWVLVSNALARCDYFGDSDREFVVERTVRFAVNNPERQAAVEALYRLSGDGAVVELLHAWGWRARRGR